MSLTHEDNERQGRFMRNMGMGKEEKSEMKSHRRNLQSKSKALDGMKKGGHNYEVKTKKGNTFHFDTKKNGENFRKSLGE